MDIKKIQQRLNQLLKLPKLEEDGIIGDETKNAIKTFQKSVGLDDDGKVGPKTLAKLFPYNQYEDEGFHTLSSMSASSLKTMPILHTPPLSLLAIKIAETQIGVKELTGKNDGEAVEIFLKSVGLGKGFPWCMSFVYWCYSIACHNLGQENPLIKTGGVLRQWNEIDSKYKSQTPVIGSIFIMDFGKGNGHTGFVTSVNTDDTVNTIEGNSNSLGSREGNQVGENKRKISSFKGFINI